MAFTQTSYIKYQNITERTHATRKIAKHRSESGHRVTVLTIYISIFHTKQNAIKIGCVQ